MVDEDKNADTADQAVDSETESSTLAAVEAKLATLQEDVVEDDDVSSDTDEEKADQVDTGDTDDKDVDEKDDDVSILPAGHRRAALARGYTNEEIDHYLETKPDEAVARFGEVFDDWQRESSLWSNRGRQLVKAGQQASGEDKEGDQKTSEVLSHYDAKALTEEHPGNEDLINALVNPLNAVIDRVNTATERLSSSEEFLRGTKETALAAVTQDFFKGKEMEASKDVYGIEVKDLTNEQVEKRMELFKEADIIVAGAEAHGEDVTAQEALERAFAIVSQGTRDEIIRQDIRNSMKKRTKTTRSSHQQTSVSDENQPISDEELVKRTEARQRALRDK